MNVYINMVYVLQQARQNKDSKNKMRVWTITTSDAGYDIVFGQLGGALQSNRDCREEGCWAHPCIVY